MSEITVGDVVDVVEFTVESGKIKEFARATFTEDPRHHAGELATATHSVVTGHQRDQRGFVARLGLAIERIVVGSVSWDYSRPLVAGDHLVATRRLEEDVCRDGRNGRMRFVTLATEFVDASGRRALVQREVLIERPTAAATVAAAAVAVAAVPVAVSVRENPVSAEQHESTLAPDVLVGGPSA